MKTPNNKLISVKKRYWGNPEKAREKAREYYWKNRDKKLKEMARYAQSLKDAAFAAYGGAVCSCCGETEKLFLTIDHVNGGGRQHRESIKGDSGAYICRWLKKNNYPPGFQVLCYNCNCGRARNGGICPHKKE